MVEKNEIFFFGMSGDRAGLGTVQRTSVSIPITVELVVEEGIPVRSLSCSLLAPKLRILAGMILQ